MCATVSVRGVITISMAAMPWPHYRPYHPSPPLPYLAPMNPEVTHYIAAAPGEQRAILELLRQLMREAVPEAKEEFKWSRPVYRLRQDFAYFKTAKAHVTLGFNKASLLDDPGGLLEGTGKDMRHLKLRTIADVDRPLLVEWFKAAAAG